MTVAIALGASLLVSMTIVPVLAYWFLGSSRKRAQPGRAETAHHDEEEVSRLQQGYLPVLGLALRRPLISLLVAVLIFAGTMASATLLKTNFLDSFADKTTLQIDQELPVGTRLSTTSDAAEEGRGHPRGRSRGQGVSDDHRSGWHATGRPTSSAWSTKRRTTPASRICSRSSRS